VRERIARRQAAGDDLGFDYSDIAPLTDEQLRACVRKLAPTPPSMRAMEKEAKGHGTDKLSMAEVDREITAVRQQQACNKKSKVRNR